jgi:amidohydrolase
MTMLTNSEVVRLTDFRHDLHRHPELSGEEERTARAVVDLLAGTRPDQMIEGLGGHGVAVVYDSGAPGPTVMFRAELDALPIEELTEVPHRSIVPGKGHLCGHDGHATILVGLGMVFARARPARGRAILLFQPAEENGSGAAAVISDPRFASIRPDWAFAIHNMPGIPLGAIGIGAGPANCASMGVRVVLDGRTAHASMPETGISPAACVADVIAALPVLAPGGAMTGEFRLASLCHVHIGQPAFGVVPGRAEMWVTLRAVTDVDLQELEREFRAEVKRRAASHGLRLSFETDDLFHACTNDDEACKAMSRAAEALNMPFAAISLPMRGSEDFGLFGHYARSAMALLGSGENLPHLHNPDFDFPDALIQPGVRLFVRLAADILGERPPLR